MATPASQSKVEASVKTAALSSVNDGLTPQNATDQSIPYFHYWPKQGGTEWITYTFPQATEVSSCTLHWFDDAPWGGCRVPTAWKVYYQKDNQWIPVPNPTAYECKKGERNTVRFTPVTTQALKLEIIQPEKYSTGVYEWEVN